MPDRNFLLGYGERLTEDIRPAGREMEKRWAYDVPTARDRLVPMVQMASIALDELPSAACPNDEAVAVVTLHPESLAKSYFPSGLLRVLDLETVGSRPKLVEPENWTKKRDPEPSPSTELFVAGPRAAFRRWAETLQDWSATSDGAGDLPRVEAVRAFAPAERLRRIEGDQERILLEVVLHARPHSDYILEVFLAYLADLGAEPRTDQRLYAGGLCFLPVRAARAGLDELAKFAFLRVARPMPSLRPMEPVVRAVKTVPRFLVELPEEGPVDPHLHVAVLDGGLGDVSGMERYANAYDADGVGAALDKFLHHGASVTSAVLFGPLEDGVEVERPYAVVEHFRVLDENSGSDENLYDVLHRVRDILLAHTFDFVNLSIGPAIPIEDDDVHSWTSVLDESLSKGGMLATVAVGNGGELDAQLQFNRIQVPSDCVNALAVGAADRRGPGWERAAYSSVGPGRSPGLVKPDVVAFGGTDARPFWVINPDDPTESFAQKGTSFAGPATLRMGLGIRAHFGDLLSPLAIRTLLVHCSEPGKADRREVGWGRVPHDIESYVVCPEGTARVVYQGELSPAQYLRARIPLPEEELLGYVYIRATFCYATETDPDHPGNYTRSGLEIVFRPHDRMFDPKADSPMHPKSASFFQLKEFSSERELRRDAHKWETTLHREVRKRGSSLQNPMFDIHYNARESSAPAETSDKIPYALVITVRSARTRDLYDRIVRRYPNQIRPLVPVVQIPVRT